MIHEYGNVIVREEGDCLVAYFRADDTRDPNRLRQSIMRKDKPRELVHWYSRAMMTFRDFRRTPKNALVIGLGGGTLTKALYYEFPKCRVLSLEPSLDMIKAAKEMFHVPRNSRSVILPLTGQHFMRATTLKFDVIMLDAYGTGEDQLIHELNTMAFYKRCRNALTEDGVFAVNLVRQIKSLKFLLDLTFVGRTKTLTNPFANNEIQLCFKNSVQSIASPRT